MDNIQIDNFQINSKQKNFSSSNQSDDENNGQLESSQKKESDNKKKEQKLKIKMKRKLRKKMTNEQKLSNKQMSNNQEQKLKKDRLSNIFSEVSKDNQLEIPNKKYKIEQEPQVLNQFLNENQKNETIIFNKQPEQIMVNKLPNFIENIEQNQYLSIALSKSNEHQHLLFQKFLNFLGITQEEYVNIQQYLPDVPSEQLPQFLVQQKRINETFQIQKQQQQQLIHQNQQINQVIDNYQQQQNDQFLINEQDQYEQFQILLIQNQQNQNYKFLQNQIQEQQYQQKFIEIEFKFNPELSDENLECDICAETYMNGDKLAILPCIHRFHLNCITSWMQKSPQCPICHQS
ncbi:unnamed protein product [Paramecium sonneborni]|uniref:RING-type E3 ubiquitin transferase n=1 Tax=Paramecium sonneborni TaxID=65129 RepID=A0A8S1QZV5_9CILI|nr:unnamed protein product [Paramecium sonneborni]